MKKDTVDFICSLHGYLIRTKEIHWNTESNSTHKLCDEIEEDIHECEDRLAECAMGEEGRKFRIGDLKPMLPNATELVSMMKELEKEAIDFSKKNPSLGIQNVLGDLVELCNKYKYRATQK